VVGEGEKFTLNAVRHGASTQPLAELLPVVPDITRADRRVIGFGHAFERAWPYELTPEGESSKVVRLREPKGANAALWQRLPGYHFAFPVLRAKPLATTLVRLTNPELARAQEAMPLLASHFVGAGRVLFSGTDEAYRWRSVFQGAYERFWVKGIRFLYEGRLASGSGRLRLRLSEDVVELGQPLQITAEVSDESYQAATRPYFELALERPGQAPRMVRLEPVEETAGEFQATIRPSQPGFFTLSPADPQDGKTDASFQVVAAAVERPGPVDLAELQAVASVAGGQLCRTPRELLDGLKGVPSMRSTETYRTPHAIWDSWVTLALIVSVLAMEWWLRKWFNLL